MGGVNGTFVAELDGVEYYTDGVKHAGTSFQVSIAYIDFAREFDSISNSGAWTIGASTRFPVMNIDNTGKITTDAIPGVFDLGVVRYSDGTFGVHGGASIGGPLIGASFSIHGGGTSSGPYGNLSTYDHIEVYSDGTLVNVEYSPGDEQFPHVKATRTYHLPDGSTHTEYTNIADPVKAADMAAGLAPQIYEEKSFWGRGECFLGLTTIGMADKDARNLIGQSAETSETNPRVIERSQKQISEIVPGDVVLSFAERTGLVAKEVIRTFSTSAAQILDLFGICVTPGHVTLCGEGPYAERYVPILDILRTDGAIVLEDGRKVRAGTGCLVDSEGDAWLTAVVGERTADGGVRVIESGRIRAGTRFILPDETDVCVLDLVREAGGEIGEDGLVLPAGAGPEMPGQPFRWPFTKRLPKPEDYVLQRSATTLEDIFAANEWEAMGPQVPGPAGVRRVPKVNVPLSLRRGEPHGRFAPIAMRREIEPVAHPEAAPAGTMLN